MTGIEYWQSRFRILKKWSIVSEKDGEYTGQVHFNSKKKKAIICPWGSGKEADDYIFHEILHTCMHEINNRKHKKKREAEELFIQDLCCIVYEREREGENNEINNSRWQS